MFTSFWQHHGIDWLALVLTFSAIYLLGNKQRAGFLLMIGGNTCWITLGIRFQSLGMVLANVIFLIMNLRGFLRWSQPANLASPSSSNPASP